MATTALLPLPQAPASARECRAARSQVLGGPTPMGSWGWSQSKESVATSAHSSSASGSCFRGGHTGLNQSYRSNFAASFTSRDGGCQNPSTPGRSACSRDKSDNLGSCVASPAAVPPAQARLSPRATPRSGRPTRGLSPYTYQANAEVGHKGNGIFPDCAEKRHWHSQGTHDDGSSSSASETNHSGWVALSRQQHEHRATVLLDSIARGLESTSHDIQQVRQRHATFLAGCAASDVQLGTPMLGTATLGSEGFALGATLHSSPQKSLASPQRSPPAAIARQEETQAHDDDDMDSSNSDESLGQKRRYGWKHLSREQKAAHSEFAAIDRGEVKACSVFETIPQTSRRVETKVEFYRHRSDLVLPPIEDKYMVPTRCEDEGQSLVDVKKLIGRSPGIEQLMSGGSGGSGGRPHSHSRSSLDDHNHNESHARSLAKGPSSTMAETQSLVKNESVASLATDRTQRTVSLSKGSSAMGTDVSVTSLLAAVSSPQRKQQLLERGALRDEHASTVRMLDKEQLLKRRYEQLEDLQRKVNRREVSRKQEVVLTWVAVGMAVQAMRSVVGSYHKSYSSVSQAILKTPADALPPSGSLGLEAVSKLSKESWNRHFEETASRLPGTIWKANAKALMVASLQVKFSAELSRVRQDLILKVWAKTVRCLKFVLRLRAQRRMSRNADMIKNLIHLTWRGYQIRASVNIYFQQIIFLQRGLKACLLFKDHICRYVLMPAIWQLETEAIAEITGMASNAIVDEEIMLHRLNWHLAGCLREIRRLGNNRTLWSLSKHRKARLHLQTSKQDEEGTQDAGLPIVDRFGHCSTTLEAKGKQREIAATRGRTVFFHAMDAYRLPEDQRQLLVRSLFRESMARWWQGFMRHKKGTQMFKEESKKWRLEALALGPENRSDWPQMPLAPPPFPQELTVVDSEKLKTRISTMLLQSNWKLKGQM